MGRAGGGGGDRDGAVSFPETPRRPAEQSAARMTRFWHPVADMAQVNGHEHIGRTSCLIFPLSPGRCSLQAGPSAADKGLRTKSACGG